MSPPELGLVPGNQDPKTWMSQCVVRMCQGLLEGFFRYVVEKCLMCFCLTVKGKTIIEKVSVFQFVAVFVEMRQKLGPKWEV